MHIVNYQILQEDDPQFLGKALLRNRYTLLGKGTLYPLNTIDCGGLRPIIFTNQSAGRSQKLDKSPKQILKELEGALHKRRTNHEQLTKLAERDLRPAQELKDWSLEGEKTTIWTQKRPQQKKRSPLSKPAEETKRLSLQLYSRMINSFKQSYHLGSSTFNLSVEKKKVRHSLNTFRESILQKDLSSELISKRRLTLLRHKSKLMGTQPPLSIDMTPRIVNRKVPDRHEKQTQKIQQQPFVTAFKSSVEQPPNTNRQSEAILSPRLKAKNNYERPWRTNFRFPELALNVTETPRHNFTPWHKVEEVEEDLPVV